MTEPAISDEWVALYRETYAAEERKRLAEVRWGEETIRETNVQVFAAYIEATRAGLAAVLAVAGHSDTEPQREVVTLRAEVIRREPGIGVLVELFSKTDQYQAWVREDLVLPGVVGAAQPTNDEAKPPDGPCEGFQWIGQTLSSCDGCGWPIGDHKGYSRLREGAGPFGPKSDWEIKPFTIEQRIRHWDRHGSRFTPEERGAIIDAADEGGSGTAQDTTEDQR